MSRFLTSYNNRGISLIEVVIAIFLVTVGVLAILSMQPSAWRVVGKSDYMGRGAGILHRELERREACIMNPCNTVATGTAASPPILVSGLPGAVSGDATYWVTTQVSKPNPAIDLWNVTVTVTWPDQQTHAYRNLTESIAVVQHWHFAYPTDNSGSCTAFSNCTLP